MDSTVRSISCSNSAVVAEGNIFVHPAETFVSSSGESVELRAWGMWRHELSYRLSICRPVVTGHFKSIGLGRRNVFSFKPYVPSALRYNSSAFYVNILFMHSYDFVKNLHLLSKTAVTSFVLIRRTLQVFIWGRNWSVLMRTQYFSVLGRNWVMYAIELSAGTCTSLYIWLLVSENIAVYRGRNNKVSFLQVWARSKIVSLRIS